LIVTATVAGAAAAITCTDDFSECPSTLTGSRNSGSLQAEVSPGQQTSSPEPNPDSDQKRPDDPADHEQGVQ
jgi:hypothetical protein